MRNEKVRHERAETPTIGNCYAYVYARLSGQPELGHLMMHSFMEKIRAMGFHKCKPPNAEIVLKTESDDFPYHAIYVERHLKGGEMLVSHRRSSGAPVETTNLSKIPISTPGARFEYYCR